MILSPMVRDRRGGHRDLLERISRNGFIRARIDGDVIDLAEGIKLDEKKSHTIEVIVDRIVLKDNIVSRLRESIALACRESDGSCIISHEVDGQWIEKLYSTRFSCPDCDLSFPTPEPRSFSFNSPCMSGMYGVRFAGCRLSRTGHRDVQPSAVARCATVRVFSRFRPL